MHQYLKAIGFGNIRTRNNLVNVLEDVRESFNQQTIVSYRPGEDFCELKKDYGQCIGISSVSYTHLTLPTTPYV